MNSSQKKPKVTKINARHTVMKVEKTAPEGEKTAPEEQTVAALAYQFWLESGRHGDDLTHWLLAEQQIKGSRKESAKS